MTKKDEVKITVNPEDDDIRKQAAPENESGGEIPEEDAAQTPEEKLEKAEAKARDAFDRFLRASAELENYKKRTHWLR